MSERRWTDEQLSAIETRDKTLLVSAAAGSGKTATLTERIIRSLTDPVSPMDIDAILVVTFTNAAASELRAKISRALTEAVEREPENKHLKRQLYLLPSAKIRTIDSFCNEILRANCDRVGVSPNYRIADTAESELLAISIIEGLIEAVYNGDLLDIATPEELERLADCLTDSKRTEELSEVFRYIHLKCDSAEEGIDLLSTLAEKYNCGNIPVEQTSFGAYLTQRVGEMLNHYIAACKGYIRSFSSGNEQEQKYLLMAEADRDMLMRMAEDMSYEALRLRIGGFSLTRKPAVRKDKLTSAMESYSVLRDMMKDDLSSMKKYFNYTTDMWHSLFASLYELLSVLCRFEGKFDALFSEEKRRLGALSYADIERYTYKCLIENGRPTDIAKNVAAQFDAIYIDEYQDVNSLQNRIFEAISRSDNRFMVGDIKQSIYGFRSACPEIFASMKASFPKLTDADGSCASIFMSRNFRCDKAIVDYVNNIFDRAFSFVKESIGYSEGDRLGYSKLQPNGEPDYIYPQLCLLDKQSDDEGQAARVVAKKISQLLADGRLNDGSPIRPSDIAIILRNSKDKDIKYAAALEELGIPVAISGAKDFFLSPEVLLALCLLNTIDNPRRDIYLAGLMCSPLFDFTADELYLIKQTKRESLYESLVEYVNCNPEFTKGMRFVKVLEYYRAIAEGVSVDTLIQKLYRETGLMSLASRSGGKENLTLLYDYARSYEAGSFKGLYSFISFINSIIDKKTSFNDTRAGDNADAVKIVTCHASKGLEYPVVFLVEADGKIYNKDRNSRLAFSEDFGISFRLRTPSGLAVVNNPAQDIVNHRITRKLYEEELRVLYVALTRARERLFVVGECPILDREEYGLKLSVLRENLSEYSFRHLFSYQEIILTCEGSTPVSEESFVGASAEETRPCEQTVEDAEVSAADDGLAEELCRRFSFEYPSPYLTELPEKMSVSVMSPTVLDGTEGESAWLEELSGEENEPIDEEKKPLLPAFILGKGADESAAKGIATHLVMQFCDLDLLQKNGASAELSRLLDEGFISREDAERVRLKEIEAFVKSDLFREMRSAKKIHRELRFNVLLPARLFTSDIERIEALGNREILVQGVIDCIVERADGSLALYDYKTDRLTRAELLNPTLAAEKLRKRHKAQLEIYSLAVERIFGRAPSVIGVYSLPLGDTVLIK